VTSPITEILEKHAEALVGLTRSLVPAKPESESSTARWRGPTFVCVDADDIELIHVIPNSIYSESLRPVIWLQLGL
jgi:hypothetical protein